MQGKFRAGAVLGAVSLAVTMGSTAPANANDDARIPPKYLNQRVDWVDCTTDGSVQCALIKSPMDWNRAATSPAITIAVSKSLQPGSTPKRLLMGNPGGPGAPGLIMAPLLASMPGGKDHLAVGFDVRGTGSSSNLSCAGAPDAPWDVRDRRQIVLDRVAAAYKHTQQHCRAGSGALLDYVSTDQTVADMNLIRAILGYQTTDYVGYSGGTWLGAFYQKYYPTHSGRFVLDSNTDFTRPWHYTFGAQPQAFQRRFEQDFQQWAAKYPRQLGLGSSAAAVNAFYERLRADVRRRPVTISQGGDSLVVDGNLLDGVTIQLLYTSMYFPVLAQAYAEIRQAWDDAYGGREVSVSSRTFQVAQAAVKPSANQPLAADAYPSTFTAITCNDTWWAGHQTFADNRSGILGRAYPLVGWAFNRNPCFYWKRPPVKLGVPTGQGVGPTLMVQSAHDPATNASLALNAHRKYAGSVLIYVKNLGDHGVYGMGIPCVDDRVNHYLQTGRAPARDVTCTGPQIPPPGARSGGMPLQERVRQLSSQIRF